jgi:site-specific DNA recombinase
MAKATEAVRARRLRCAVYTRKSSEEGLEQEFNSLHAQREACEAYIRSQRHEGWTCLPQAYDDGGFSGGTMDRPALRHLLSDIRDGKVDVIVTYKIDRLTRSLADFAKITEIFEARGVSFVSVTQQFNTTTSMGRLTLNVLLSFAQFEREVAGERIRDKIAASKRKGMWMGGVPPLGYRVQDRKLVVIPEEGDTVRHIFRRYVALGSVRLLQEELEATALPASAGSAVPAGAGAASRSPAVRSICYCKTGSIAARSSIRTGITRASTRRSSIPSCGTRCKPSSRSTRSSAVPAHAPATRACSRDCCSTPTATG